LNSVPISDRPKPSPDGGAEALPADAARQSVERESTVAEVLNVPGRKVLVLMPDFPGLGGGSRYKIIRYLSQFGCHPVVITDVAPPEPENIPACDRGRFTILRARCFRKSPFRVFSRFFNAWELAMYLERVFFVPDLYVNWVPSAYLRASRLVREQRFDSIFSTSPPESVHLAALLLKRRRKIRWVADFRDLWTTKQIIFRPPSRWHDRVVKRMERTIYREADHVIANTRGNRDVYSREFGIPDRKMTVIPGGYDPEDFQGLDSARASGGDGVLRIGYMGRLDKDGFPWREFAQALGQALASCSGAKVEFAFCGSVKKETLAELISTLGAGRVRHHGLLPHTEAVKLMSRCQVLLMLLYETDYSRAIVPHKLYYYLGLNRPILAISDDQGEAAAIIRKTNTGVVISAKEPGNIAGALRGYIKAWKEGGTIPHRPNEREISHYSVVSHARDLARVLDGGQDAERAG